MKTLHHDQYWSAHPKENRIPFSMDGELSKNHDEFHDNMFCLFPDATIEFMKTRKIPRIAFKVLAGGAIHPADGFQFAFDNGADFICVGMFDWQIVDDVNIALDRHVRLADRGRRQHRAGYAGQVEAEEEGLDGVRKGTTIRAGGFRIRRLSPLLR